MPRQTLARIWFTITVNTRFTLPRQATRLAASLRLKEEHEYKFQALPLPDEHEYPLDQLLHIEDAKDRQHCVVSKVFHSL